MRKDEVDYGARILDLATAAVLLHIGFGIVTWAAGGHPLSVLRLLPFLVIFGLGSAVAAMTARVALIPFGISVAALMLIGIAFVRLDSRPVRIVALFGLMAVWTTALLYTAGIFDGAPPPWPFS